MTTKLAYYAPPYIRPQEHAQLGLKDLHINLRVPVYYKCRRISSLVQFPEHISLSFAYACLYELSLTTRVNSMHNKMKTESQGYFKYRL